MTPIDILGCDPGETTGFARWYEHENSHEVGVLTEFEQLTGPGTEDNEALYVISAAEYIRDWIKNTSMHSKNVLVMENFDITQRTLRTRLRSASLILIGWAQIECAKAGIEFVLQSPAKKSISNQRRLKALNFWPKGMRHAQDAARHVDVYLSTQRTPYYLDNIRNVIND